MDIAAGVAALVALLAMLRAATENQGGEVSDQDTPRGIRNHNPGNIVDTPANDWQGKTGTDGKFVVFSAPAWGIRAIARILDSYRLRGVDTLGEIVATYAPPGENPTAAYIQAVEDITGLERGNVIERHHYPALIEAMIYFENGVQPYGRYTIVEGIARA